MVVWAQTVSRRLQNDPSWLSGPYLTMSEYWQPIKVCVGGTQAFRENCGELLPIEPKEDEAAWHRRVSHAVLSPFTTRIAEQAAGLILRKPIQLEPMEEGGEVDPYWDEFAQNVDGYGTDLDSYARRLVLSSILFGHAATIVDFPTTEPAPNLAVERELGLRPYFLEIDAANILGWRKAGDSPIAPIGQVRINEYVTEDLGAFGDEVVRQIRVLEPGKWSLWRRGERWLGFVSGRNHQPACYSNGSDVFQQAERANEQAAAVANCQPQHLACTTPGRPSAQLARCCASNPCAQRFRRSGQ